MDGRIGAGGVGVPRLPEGRGRIAGNEEEVRFRFAGGYLEQVEECARPPSL